MKTKLLAAILIVIQLGWNNQPEIITMPCPIDSTAIKTTQSRARTSAYLAFEKLAEENKVSREEFENYMNTFDSLFTR